MSYAIVEAAAAAVIIKHADYDAENCAQGDYRVVGHGKARAAVLTYGGVVEEELSLGLLRRRWTVNVDLFVPWPGQEVTWEANMATEREKIAVQVAAWPKLDGAANVIAAHLRTGATPIEAALDRGSYKGQRLAIEVEEMVSPGRQE